MRQLLITALFLFALTAQSLAAPMYIVREKDGMAAYLDLARGSWHETDCAVCALPNASDRALLRCGIPAETDGELTRILEDFCS